MFRLNLAGDSGLKDLSRDLKRAGGGHRERVAQSLRKPTKTVFQAVEQRVLTGSMAGRPVPGAKRRFPSSLGRGNHVRRPVLRGLAWKVSTSAGNPRADITWNPGRIDGRVRKLFPYLVRQKSRLRHPIMGKTADGKWRGGASQRMPDAWSPVRKLAPEAQKAVAAAVDDTAAIIGGRK